MTTDKKTATQHFTESFDDFCVGLVKLQDMRAIIAELLNDEPRSAEMILATIDTAFRDGLIKSSTYDELTTDVDRATSEDEPTEWSDETLAQESNDISADEDTGYPSTELTKTTDSPLPATTDLAPGAVLKNRFELVAHIGAGSMADVYEAIDRRQQEAGAADPRLAIKVISRAYSTHPHALKTLQHEALNSQGLINPNIIRVFDFDRDGDRFFMTMELLDGQSLVKILDEHRFQPLPITQSVEIIKGMCRGLQYAHQQGIIHADIKPGNIFITTAKQVKILDFGISRIANGDIAGDSSPVTGAHTPAYASCEVLEGAEPTKQDDLFALACVAYRMLAGHRAFDGLTALEAESKQHKPQRIETLNKQQWQVLQQSLALRCADRTVSLAAFTAAFSYPTPVADTPQVEPESATNSTRSYPVLRGLPLQFGIPAIAVMLIAITLALFWPEPEATPVPLARTEIFVPDAMDPPSLEEIQPAAEAAPTPAAEPVVSAAPPIIVAPTIITDEPTIVPAEPILAVAPPPDPEQIRINELAMLADDAMNDGRLLGPADDNAHLFITELTILNPEASEVQPRRARLAELMLLEAMVAITDEDFDAATRWIEETRMLDVPEETTQRFEIELQKARDAKSMRQTESIGAIFASAIPAAILANPPINYSAEQITTQAIITTDPVVVAGSLSLAMLQPGALTDTTTEVIEEEPAGETADTSNQDIALSKLEFKNFVEPKIPRRLGARKVPGWVEVRFRVMTNGKTDNITVIAVEPDNRYEKSAVSAIKKWRFKPIYIDGIAIEKYSTIRLRFEPE